MFDDLPDLLDKVKNQYGNNGLRDLFENLRGSFDYYLEFKDSYSNLEDIFDYLDGRIPFEKYSCEESY